MEQVLLVGGIGGNILCVKMSMEIDQLQCNIFVCVNLIAMVHSFK